MSTVQRLMLAAAALLAVGLAAWLVAARREPHRRRDLPLTAQGGYPPPGAGTTAVPPSPMPTPTPTAIEGLFPPPEGIEHRVEPLAASPYRELLVALQAAIDAGDPAGPADWVAGRFGTRLFDVRHIDSEGGVTMDRATTAALLGAFLDLGARPRVQGYFAVDDGQVACLDVVTAPYAGEVAYPATPAPLGPRPPDTLVGDAAAFHVCRDQAGAWLWQAWAYGGYHAIVEAYDARRGVGEPPYVVSRP